MTNQEKKDAVWEKRAGKGNAKPNAYCTDIEGNKIKYDDYGNRDSDYGWEIDHIHPESRGGSDELSNLQPLQWEANMKKSNKIAYEDMLL